MMEFKNELTDAQRKMVEELMGKPEAEDGKTFLYNRLKMPRRKLAKIAREVAEGVTARTVDEGQIITMKDGTRYEVTARGWVRV